MAGIAEALLPGAADPADALAAYEAAIGKSLKEKGRGRKEAMRTAVRSNCAVPSADSMHDPVSAQSYRSKGGSHPGENWRTRLMFASLHGIDR
jgi:hypothetical protein